MALLIIIVQQLEEYLPTKTDYKIIQFILPKFVNFTGLQK